MGPREAFRAPPPPTATTAFEMAPDGSAPRPGMCARSQAAPGDPQRSLGILFLADDAYRLYAALPDGRRFISGLGDATARIVEHGLAPQPALK